MLDSFDLAILAALQRDASLTNATLSQRVHLSPSQCSRRRANLEQRGYITGYHARLDAARLGLGVRVFIRLTLAAHSERTAEALATFLQGLDQVEEAHLMSGDADYILCVRARDLDQLAEFIQRQLLPHPQVSQVRSEIVLKTIKDGAGLPLRHA
jgi:DNA-binding Lrp family transcriptional regulator